MISEPADAQFFKKLFKKKAKTEKKASTKTDGIDDDAQVAMADFATLADPDMHAYRLSAMALAQV